MGLTIRSPPRKGNAVSMAPLPRFLFPAPRAAFCLLLLLSVLAGGSGCTYYRSLGKGQRLEPANDRPHRKASGGSEDLVVAISTDAAGNIVNVEFIKHSRSQAVEQYVAQTIVDGFPRQPSTRTVVRLRHTSNAGFSDPEVVSTEPIGG